MICYLASDNESVWKIPINIDFPDKFRSENSPTTPSKWLETKTDTMQSVFKPYFLNIKSTGKAIHPKYYKHFEKGAHQSHLGRQKMGWFLVD